MQYKVFCTPERRHAMLSISDREAMVLTALCSVPVAPIFICRCWVSYTVLIDIAAPQELWHMACGPAILFSVGCLCLSIHPSRSWEPEPCTMHRLFLAKKRTAFKVGNTSG